MYAPIFPPVIGGPSTQSFNLCKALVAHGVAPIVVTPGTSFLREYQDGFRIYRYRWHYTNTAIDKVIRWVVFTPFFLFLLLSERPDIVHAHSVSASSFIAGFFAKLLRIPSIVKFAGDWVWETLSTSKVQGKDFDDIYSKSYSGRFLKYIERGGISLFDIIWCPSQFRKENVRRLLGTTERVRVIPNALLLPRGGFRDEDPGDPVTVVSANRFIPHKRVATIVRAFKDMAIPGAKLVLVGSGAEVEVEKVKEAIIETGLQTDVVLTGALSSEDVYAEFERASFYVSASLEEGFPNVFIEAMHFGLPIVSTDVGGCREMVEEGRTGFLVDPHDESALVESMRKLATDRNLRNTFAKAAYERSKRYDLSVVVEEFIELYKRLARI